MAYKSRFNLRGAAVPPRRSNVKWHISAHTHDSRHRGSAARGSCFLSAPTYGGIPFPDLVRLFVLSRRETRGRSAFNQNNRITQITVVSTVSSAHTYIFPNPLPLLSRIPTVQRVHAPAVTRTRPTSCNTYCTAQHTSGSSVTRHTIHSVESKAHHWVNVD